MDCGNFNFLIKNDFKIDAGQQLVFNRWSGDFSLCSPPARAEGFMGLINRIVRFFYQFFYTSDQIKVLEKVDETLKALSQEEEYFKKNQVTLKNNFSIIKNSSKQIDSSEAVIAKIKQIKYHYFPKPSNNLPEEPQEILFPTTPAPYYETEERCPNGYRVNYRT